MWELPYGPGCELLLATQAPPLEEGVEDDQASGLGVAESKIPLKSDAAPQILLVWLLGMHQIDRPYP